jgi:hypothetical protein
VYALSDFGAFQTRATQAAFVFASQFLKRFGAEFDLAAPTPIQADFACERLTARRAFLCAV